MNSWTSSCNYGTEAHTQLKMTMSEFKNDFGQDNVMWDTELYLICGFPYKNILITKYLMYLLATLILQ